MNQPDDLDWTLLDRYVAREATPAEAAQVERWLDTDPAHRELLEAMQRPVGAQASWDVARAWASVRSRTLTNDPPHSTSAPSTVPAARRTADRWFSRAALLRAAMLVAVLGAAALAARVWLQSDDAGEAALLVATTGRSESDTVRLPDGSVIVLAAESRLEYPRNFGPTARQVRMTGEVWFEVAPDRARPFTVFAGHAAVEVVGTKFVVHAPTDTAAVVTVAVAEGAVSVRSVAAGGAAGTGVRVGEVARISEGGETTVTAADLEAYTDWLQGVLSFDDAPLGQVLTELRRWYPVEFQADSTLLQRRVTARLRIGALAETVDVLAFALGTSHHRSNDTITFTMSRSPK